MIVTDVARASERASVPDAESASLSIFFPFFWLILHKKSFTAIVMMRMKSIGSEIDTGLGFCILSIDDRKKAPPVKSTMNATKSAEIYSILPNPRGWVCVGFLFAILKPIIVTADESMSEALFAASDMIATDPENNPMITFTAAIAAFDMIPSIAVLFKTLLRVSSATIYAVV